MCQVPETSGKVKKKEKKNNNSKQKVIYNKYNNIKWNGNSRPNFCEFENESRLCR
jgi:hypothetical protein